MAAIPHGSPLFCFTRPPHGLLSSSWACMQSVSEAFLVQPKRAPTPLALTAFPGLVASCKNPSPLSGTAGALGDGGWWVLSVPGPRWLPSGGFHLSVGSPGPALQARGQVIWLLPRQTPVGSCVLSANQLAREVRGHFPGRGAPRAPLGCGTRATPEFLGKASRHFGLGWLREEGHPGSWGAGMVRYPLTSDLPGSFAPELLALCPRLLPEAAFPP